MDESEGRPDFAKIADDRIACPSGGSKEELYTRDYSARMITLHSPLHARRNTGIAEIRRRLVRLENQIVYERAPRGEKRKTPCRRDVGECRDFYSTFGGFHFGSLRVTESHKWPLNARNVST